MGSSCHIALTRVLFVCSVCPTESHNRIPVCPNNLNNWRPYHRAHVSNQLTIYLDVHRLWSGPVVWQVRSMQVSYKSREAHQVLGFLFHRHHDKAQQTFLAPGVSICLCILKTIQPKGLHWNDDPRFCELYVPLAYMGCTKHLRYLMFVHFA